MQIALILSHSIMRPGGRSGEQTNVEIIMMLGEDGDEGMVTHASLGFYTLSRGKFSQNFLLKNFQ